MWVEGVQDRCVIKELNPLLTALHVLIDDHVVRPRTGRGNRPLFERQRADHAGRSPGVVGLSRRTPLDPARAQRSPVAGHVPVPAAAVGLPQAVEVGAAVAVHGDPHPGHALPVPVRRHVDHRRHPRALRHVPGNGEALRPGRARRLRLLRVAFPLVPGPQAVSGLCRGRDADHVVPGQPQESANARWSPRCWSTTTTSSGPGRSCWPTRASPASRSSV